MKYWDISLNPYFCSKMSIPLSLYWTPHGAVGWWPGAWGGSSFLCRELGQNSWVVVGYLSGGWGGSPGFVPLARQDGCSLGGLVFASLSLNKKFQEFWGIYLKQYSWKSSSKQKHNKKCDSTLKICFQFNLFTYIYSKDLKISYNTMLLIDTLR